MTKITCPVCTRQPTTTNRDCPRCRITCTCDSFVRRCAMREEQRKRYSIHMPTCPISPDGYGLKTDAIIAAGY